MPRLDGYGLIARLRERGSTVPVVLITGYDGERPGAGAPAGVTVLQKPFAFEHFLSLLADSLA